MKRQIVITIGGIALAIATAVLWLRVRSLETTVDALNQRLQSAPNVTTVGQTKSGKDSEHPPVFKLIESAKHNPDTTNIGVPWDVERAMIGGAGKNAPLWEDSIHSEMSPATPTIESPSQPKMNLDFLNRESDSN